MKRKIRPAPYLYILLSTFFLVLFIYYPAIKTMWKSLYVVNAENHPVAFVGLKNYVTLFRDADFINAIKVTFIYTIITVPCTILLAYILALFSAKRRRASSVYELLYALPMAVSMSVACVIFRIFVDFSDDYRYLARFGNELSVPSFCCTFSFKRDDGSGIFGWCKLYSKSDTHYNTNGFPNAVLFILR